MRQAHTRAGDTRHWRVSEPETRLVPRARNTPACFLPTAALGYQDPGNSPLCKYSKLWWSRLDAGRCWTEPVHMSDRYQMVVGSHVVGTKSKGTRISRIARNGLDPAETRWPSPPHPA